MLIRRLALPMLGLSLAACTADVDPGAAAREQGLSALAAEPSAAEPLATEDLARAGGRERDDLIRLWNSQVLAAARARSLNDAQVARSLAMVHVAMYDAINGITGEREPAMVAPSAAARGSCAAAATRAAHDVLVALFPEDAQTYDSVLTGTLATISDAPTAAAGAAWGAAVAAEVIARRANDGSTPAESQPAGTGPGQFRAAFSNAQFRRLVPFAIASAAPYISSGPPALTTTDYAAAYAEVQILGSAAIVDPDKAATFTFWSLGNGTSQPPGAWAQIASDLSTTHPRSLASGARLFALLSMAMADSVAPTYASKFQSHAWRPTTAIREGDTDGNPLTAPDATWAARAGSVGGTPEHCSGHSSFSAAAATVLAGVFCDDEIAFDFASESAPAGARHYESFSAAMTEAGRSRVFGGQHFEFSNQAGLRAGKRIAREVLSTKLLRRKGPTHLGSCPL